MYKNKSFFFCTNNFTNYSVYNLCLLSRYEFKLEVCMMLTHKIVILKMFNDVNCNNIGLIYCSLLGHS